MYPEHAQIVIDYRAKRQTSKKKPIQSTLHPRHTIIPSVFLLFSLFVQDRFLAK